jgi:hypothetical protein
MTDQEGYDRKLRAAERAHDLVDDLGKGLRDASTKDAQEAIKLLLLINSGAAVAILAFIGSLASRSGVTLANLRAVINSLYWFMEGIVIAAVVAAFAYVANISYSGHLFTMDKIWEHPYIRDNSKSQRLHRLARFLNWAGFVLAWIGLLLFIRGVYVVARAVEELVAAS